MAFRGIQIGKPVYATIMVNIQMIYGFLSDIFIYKAYPSFLTMIGGSFVIFGVIIILCENLQKEQTNPESKPQSTSLMSV